MSIQAKEDANRGAAFWAAGCGPGRCESAIVRSRDFLLSQQHPDGYWCGELEADSMLEADYIFLHTLLESGDPGRLSARFTEMMRYQNEDGSWSIYPGGPGNISLSVKCYSSAKLMGVGADDPRWPSAASGFWRTAA
jgi:squalene-hopene/tetraprenyl-beta-curcumene cyclase